MKTLSRKELETKVRTLKREVREWKASSESWKQAFNHLAGKLNRYVTKDRRCEGL